MPPGAGRVGSIFTPSGGVIRAAKTTSPCALTVGRPRNCFTLPMSLLMVPPMLATTLRSWVTKLLTMICSVLLPTTRARNAIQPLPAAEGSPTKLGPAKDPPPGTGSPRYATVAFEAAPAGAASTVLRRMARTCRQAGAGGRRITTGYLRVMGVPGKAPDIPNTWAVHRTRGCTTIAGLHEHCPGGQMPPISHQPAGPSTPGSRHEA